MTADPEDSEHTIEFLDSFADLDDPRQQGKVLYPLEEILLLCLCAVLSGADCWVGVALYGQQRLQFLRRFLPFQHGTPSHDNWASCSPSWTLSSFSGVSSTGRSGSRLRCAGWWRSTARPCAAPSITLPGRGRSI